MKLLRYGRHGQERPGLVDGEGVIRDLSGVIADIGPATLSPERLAMLRALDPAALPPVEATVRIGPCVGAVGQLVCTGLNYADHVSEAKAAVPSEPSLFLKSVSAISGPYDEIVLPRASRHTDWEIELGIVIGTAASHVSEGRALAHVAGYCIANDLSEREFQFRHGEPSPPKGKSADTFAPIGPYLVTSDEIPDPQALDLFCDIGGVRMQSGSTRDMVFGCAALVSYMSRYLTLRPGDIILTGTPAGTGMGQKPERYLRPGDTVRLGITGLGEQSARVVGPRDA